MKSFTSVLVAGFAALAQAVQLTNTNFNVQAGQAFEITWSDASGPVTLTLKNGPSTDLKTVSTIASEYISSPGEMSSDTDFYSSWPEWYLLLLDSFLHPPQRPVRHRDLRLYWHSQLL